ncbi:MAG: DUF4835 family protein [Bacteroidota bacterium]|nr:DUF4835 family protein [Bacteroidota bacterium]
MQKLFYFTCLLLLILSSIHAEAQELRCNVNISGQKLENANRNVFRTLQKEVYEFMNNRKWTNHIFSNDERIECSIYINLDEQISGDEYKGSIHVQAQRPVYNSSYKTTLLNIKDNDLRFHYIEYQPLDFNETSNKNNLTSVLAYYAYIILGVDYDSFSSEGGTEFYQKAQSIVNKSQNAQESGWKAFESDRNRYWLVENILNKSYSPFRQLLYHYHRLGLDLMAEKPEVARAEVADAMKNIQKVYRTRPALYINQIFFDAKSDELVGIFSKSFQDEKNRIISILEECDPSNLTKYDKIKNAQ